MFPGGIHVGLQIALVSLNRLFIYLFCPKSQGLVEFVHYLFGIPKFTKSV